MESGISGLLMKNRIFEGLSETEIAEILPCVALGEKTYAENECVYEKADGAKEFGVVIKGGLQAVGDGGEAAAIPPNGMFGELVVFSTGGALRERIVAAEGGATVLFLSPDFFFRSCGKGKDCLSLHGEVMANMLRLLSDRAISLGKQVAYLSAPDLRTKIARYLLELYEVNRTATFTMPLNRNGLADFFSVARPSLSRELVRLKEQGLIDFHRSSVTVLDIPGLSQIAACGHEDLGGSAPKPPLKGLAP